MLQKHKKQDAGEQSSGLDKLKEKFIQEKEQVIDTSVSHDDRIVRLKVSMDQFCGCGGKEDVEVDRTVPWDSELQDGDSVSGLDDSDQILGYL